MPLWHANKRRGQGAQTLSTPSNVDPVEFAIEVWKTFVRSCSVGCPPTTPSCASYFGVRGFWRTTHRARLHDGSKDFIW